MAKQSINSPSDLPSWRIDNLIPFVLVIGSFFIYLVRLSIVETKLDNLLATQQEFNQEFKEWRKQSETRLGIAEGNLRVLSSSIGVNIR